MKRIILLGLILLYSGFNIFAQNEEKRIFYKAGLGPSIEGNIGLIGLTITNEFYFELGSRLAFHPSINYFGTLRQWENNSGLLGFPDFQSTDSHAGFFINAPIQLKLFNIKSVSISGSVGPTLEIGTSTFLRSAQFDFDAGEWTDFRYDVEYHRRVGYLTSLVFDWPNKSNPKRDSSIMISVYAFDNYFGYFLMTTYRLGFQL